MRGDTSIDFPRLPLTGNLELFRALARLGGELTALHLLESPRLDQPITEFIGGRNPEVEKVSWTRETVWVDKAQTTGFCGVREPVWNFHIGGYQVCEKWLKDRKGRTLTKDDIVHYHKIVVALSETIRLMKEIDEAIDRHGGWPGAFATKAPSGGAGASVSDDRSRQPAPAPYVVDLPESALPVAAERAETSAGGPTIGVEEGTAPGESQSDTDMMALIRQSLSLTEHAERDDLIRDLARALGYQRTGPRIREELDDAIRTAVRRGVAQNENGRLSLLARSIEGYDREFLKVQFLASLGGRAWISRDDAIRSFARWLGFQRTGSSIDEVTRSLISGLIREGRIEGDRESIRRVS